MHNDLTPHDAPDHAYRRYFDALLAGDRAQCQHLVDAWLARDPNLRGLYEGLFQRSLYEVGTLWEQGKASVATEHLVTAITERLLAHVYPRLFEQPRVNKSALVSCAADEYHQVGARMVADTIEMNGWRCGFLGANTPIQELLALIAEKQPDVVLLSVTIYFNRDAMLKIAQSVRDAFPDVPILFGGQAFHMGGVDPFERIKGVRYMPNLAELELWLKSQT